MADVRLIDANEVITIQVFDEMTEEYTMQTMTIAEMIDRWADEGCPPTIDAMPVVHGRWVYDRPNHYKCSECDAMWSGVVRFMIYCPDCGAKMDAKEE